MKVWIKYLLGIALGIITAFILPVENIQFNNFISFLTEFFIRFGRYLVVPLIFSTGIISINKLRSSKILFKTFGWTLIIIVFSTFILTLVGLLSIVIVRIPRIPITVDNAVNAVRFDIKGLILSLFPYFSPSLILIY